jgi:hypothetical protein
MCENFPITFLLFETEKKGKIDEKNKVRDKKKKKKKVLAHPTLICQHLRYCRHLSDALFSVEKGVFLYSLSILSTLFFIFVFPQLTILEYNNKKIERREGVDYCLCGLPDTYLIPFPFLSLLSCFFLLLFNVLPEQRAAQREKKTESAAS